MGQPCLFLSTGDATKLLAKISEFHYQKRESAASILSKKYGSGTGKINRSADRYANDAEEAISSIEMADWRYGKYTSVIILFDEDIELLNEKVKIVKSVIDNCGLMGKVEKINCFEAYLGSLPGMVYPNLRKWVMNSYNLSDLIPTSAVWSGYKNNPCTYYANNNPVLFYASTAGGTPFRGCLHVGDDGHALVIGANGSIVMNFLAAQQGRYKNARVFVFDSNHSSLTLSYSIPQSVHYDLGYDSVGSGGTTTFQPLAYLDTQEDLSFCIDWLAELCEVNGFKVQPAHVTIISEVLEIMRREANTNQRTLSYFYYLISSRNEELATQYKPYITSTGGGLQSQIFDAKENRLTLTNFTVFEMNQLARKGDTTLIPTILYLFHMIERSLSGTPVSIYIHDGWTIFKHPVFRDYLDDWLRKIASQNVQIIIGVHQPSDIIKSEIAEILMQSCKTKIFTANLNANGTQKPSYEELGLNEMQISLISNAIVNQEYYFTSPLGNRLIQFNLGELAKVFLYPQLDIDIIRQLKAKHGDLFGYEWILHNKLLPEMAEYWLKMHNQFRGQAHEG